MKKIRHLIAGAGTGMIFAAVIMFIGITSNHTAAKHLYTSYETRYTFENTQKSKETDIPWYEKKTVDFASLQKQNPDIVGWIFFENERISYPLLYSGDDVTYLYHAADKSKSDAGSIFVEGANHPDFEDCYTIIYGHNMRDLSMFGKLRYYRQKSGYDKTHAFFQILTKDNAYRYQIFAYSQVDAHSWVYRVPYASDEVFGEFIKKLYANSMTDTNVQANPTDKIVTLSTCAQTGKRLVIHAVRVDEQPKRGTENEKRRAPGEKSDRIDSENKGGKTALGHSVSDHGVQ